MNHIVFLDGYTINPGDLTWQSLEALGHFTVYDRTAPEEVLQRASEAEILIVNKTRLQRQHFEALPALRLVCVAATGYDGVDVQAAADHGVTVCNCAGYSSRAVAQLVASLLLEVADAVGTYVQRNSEGMWCDSPDFCYTLTPRMELVGKRMAIVGFGNIGRAVANVMRPFGLQLFAVTSKHADQLPADVSPIGLEEAFATCDVVSLNCPLTASNRAFVNAALLAKANPRLILINTARGALVDEQAVADALHTDRMLAYCADVLTQEPPLPTCPLLSAPRAYITPHIGWATPEARSRILAILEANIRGFIAGTPQNVVRP